MSKEKETTMSLGAAVLGAFAVVCALGLMSLILIKWAGSDQKALNEVIEGRETKLAELETGMAQERDSYKIISEDKGTVQLPLDVAMKVSLKDLQNKPPQPSSVPVDPAAAAAAPAPAKDAEAAEEVVAETEGTAEGAEVAPADAEASE